MTGCGPCKALPTLFLCAITALGQNALPSAKNPPADGGANTHGIRLNVVVEGSDGKPVTGLTQQDFTILDNKAPQQIRSFQATNGVADPVEIVVLIDSVNVGYMTIAYERQEIDKFFQTSGGKLPYPTTLAIFSDTSTKIMNGFSRNGSEMSASLDHSTIGLRALTRASGIQGAGERLDLSLKTVHQLAVSLGRLPGRKLVLWMSPGWPMYSGPAIDLTNNAERNIFNEIVNLSAELRMAGITLYAVDPLGAGDVGFHTLFYRNFLKPVHKPSQASFGNLSLQVLATQSGGLVLNSSNDIASLMQRAVDDASAYYSLTFDPVRGEPDEYHQIQVRVAKPGLAARAQTGYYSR